METKRYGHECRYRGHMHNVDVGVGGISLSLWAIVWSGLCYLFAFLRYRELVFAICLFLVYDTLLPSTGGWAYIFSAGLV